MLTLRFGQISIISAGCFKLAECTNLSIVSFVKSMAQPGYDLKLQITLLTGWGV